MKAGAGKNEQADLTTTLSPSQDIQKERQAIAHQWFHAILSAGFCQVDSTEALQAFTRLTDQIISFLLAENPQIAAAREIGSSLAGLPCVDPLALELSGQLWADQVIKGGLPAESAVLYPRLGILLNGMAAGFTTRARQIVLADQEEIRSAIAADLLRTTRELRKYQSQLETILAERTRELRESEEQFRVIADTSIEGIFQSSDDSATIIYINDAYARILGYTKEELLGKSTLDLIADEEIPKLPQIAEKVRNNLPVFGEMRMKHKEGRLVDIHYSMVPTQLNGRTIRSGIILDITEQKRIQEELFQSEERYRTLAETSPAMIFIVGPDDCIQYVNSFAMAFLGLPQEEIVGQPRERFFPSPANAHQKRYILKALTQGKTSYVESLTKINNKSLWIGTWLVPLRDASGNISAVMGVSQNITRRKRAEMQARRSRVELEKRVKERTAELTTSQNQLKLLTNQLVTALEVERRHISRELHDEAGQALISLKYSLASIENDIPKDHLRARERLNGSMETIDRVMQQIRTLSHSLRPPALEVMGINLCLKDYCEEISKQIGLPINYRGEEIPGLPDEIGICLYRFVQEALTNTLKHAHANKVSVRLTHRKDEIALIVSDNGRGMEELAKSDGIGLIGISERLNLLGGEMEIQSTKGKGVQISACVPWPV